MRERSRVVRYGLAVAVVVLATIVRHLLDVSLEDRFPFVTYFIAVIAVGWWGGFGPAMLATGLSCLVAEYAFIAPRETLSGADADSWIGIGLFAAASLGIAFISGSMRTAKCRAERHALRFQHERERFAVTLESIGDGVIATDMSGRITFLNKVAENLTGWTRTEAEGKPLETIFRIVDERTGEAIENPAGKALLEKQVVGMSNRALLVSKDGTELAIDDSAAPIRENDGRIEGVVLVFRDVSETRRLRHETDRLAWLVESSEDAVLGMTFDLTGTHWNEGAERIFGFTAEEFAGRPMWETILPEDRIEESRAVLERIRQGERVDHFETFRLCKDGRRLEVSIRISPIRDEDGHIVGASAIDRDITQRRMNERRRAARLAFTQLLAQEVSLEKICGGILETVCETLEWDGGAIWLRDERDDKLRCIEFWKRAGTDLEDFARATQLMALTRGSGLPGRVWEQRDYLWVANVSHEPSPPDEEESSALRRKEAMRAGLHGAFACPIHKGNTFLGTIEFFNHEIREPDADLLEMMSTIAGQFGQYLERSKAEALLRSNEQNLDDFFENAAIGLHWVGPDGTILRANQAELDLLGYEHDEYVGHNITEFHADRDTIEEILATLLRGDVLRNCESRLRCKDGSLRTVLIDSSGLWRDGRFIHTRCFTRDVTEQKRLEQALRRRVQALVEAEERMRSVVDHVLDGIITIDERGTIQTFNPAAERLFGWSSEETIGRNVDRLMPEPYRSRHDGSLMDYRRAGEAKASGVFREFEGMRKDGSTFPMELAISDFHLDGKRYVTGIIRDVTESKRQEATLRFLADASSSLSALVDYRSTLQTVARLAVPGFADWSAVDILNEDGGIERLAVSHVDPDKVEFVDRLQQEYPSATDDPHGVYQVLRSGEPEFVPEISDEMIVEAARDERHLELIRQLGLKSYIAVPLVAQERTLGVLTFASAESGRIYRADDLAVASDLARRASIAIENARLYQEVREAGRRKDEFLAMLAHELRNPLAPIRSGLDILGMEPGIQCETVNLMQQQVEHLVRLVDDLLDVSRIMRGKVELRRQPVSIAVIVRRAVEAVRWSIESQHQKLEMRLPDDEIVVDVDPVRLVQVIENLLNNASKYTDSGGRIEVFVESRVRTLTVHVRDDGIGIEPELLPTIFDLFTQSDRSLDRAQGGLGIGLTLVRSLIEAHGGNITALSEGSGKGSEFIVRLPISDAVPQTEETPSEPHTTTGTRRVLVVDDNVGAVRMLALLLQRLGPHEVETAHDGQGALDKLSEFRPEIVLLDIGLPGMDGYEVARRVRRNAVFDDVLLVALTGYGQEEDRRKSRQAGFDEHLVKPPSMDRIARILTRHPGRSPAAHRENGNGPVPDSSRPSKPRRSIATPDQSPIPETREIGGFFRQLAHDVGNSIVPIRLMLELLKRPDVDAETVSTVTSMLDEHLPSMNRLVEDLRRIGRITCGSFTLRREAVDPRTVVETAAASVQPLFEERRQAFESRISESLPELRVDRELVEQALAELLKNAATYGPPGCRITVEVDESHDPDEAIVLRVRNPSERNATELPSRIFKLFVRGDEDRDAGGSHWGIGLGFVQQVAEKHGGRIDAEIAADDSSECCFTIRLPVAADVPEAVGEIASAAEK